MGRQNGVLRAGEAGDFCPARLRAARVDIAEHIGEFPEVEAAFSIPNTTLELVRGQCPASLDDGGSLELVGFLWTQRGSEKPRVLHFHRVLAFDQDCAEHKTLKVEPEFRGDGLSSALLLRSFSLYKALGLRRVEVKAHMETGKWHWGRVGFDFERSDHLERMKDWALEVVKRVGVRRPGIDKFTAAAQFATMEGNRPVSLAEIGTTPYGDLGEIAKQNCLDPQEPIRLGRAVMLTGPAWDGHLDLYGPSYTQFKAYAEAKAEARQAG